ncbi:MAG TPA: amino acid permease [Gemmatimonadales bacterium]|nr:amino acid permease [Gemmatimonadales bacterium]
MTDPKAESSQFVQGIGPLAAISLVVGIMIGSGIFIVSADIGRQVNSWGPAALILVWVLTGLVTVAGALTYAELAAMMPKAGGQYVFLRDGLSPLIGFLYGWTLFAVIQTGTIAAVAVAFGRFLSVLFPGITPDVYLSLGSFTMPGGPITLGLSHQRVVALLVVAFLTAVNLRGVKLGAAVQTTFAVAKIGGLAALILLGLFVFRRSEIWSGNLDIFWGTAPWTTAMIPIIGAAMVGSLFSADSWNNVTFAAAEVRDPKKNLPLALLVGTALVSTIYVLANLAYLNVLPFAGDPTATDALGRGIQNAAQDRVGSAAVEVMLGPYGAYAMAVAIMMSTFGCVNGLVLAGPRVYYAMARDGLFFKQAGTLHPTWRTPTFGLIAQAVWAMLLCISGSYGNLLDYVVFASLLFYFFTTISLFRLRQTQPDLPRPVKAFAYPYLPGLYILSTLSLMVMLLFQRPQYAGLGLLIVALGVPIYFAWGGGKGASPAE